MGKFRQQDVQNPHFSLPFRFGGLNGGAMMNEQDSGEDIVDCIKVIVAYPIGTRADMPEFGIHPLLFEEWNESLIEQIRSAIEIWEERAVTDVDGNFSLTDEMLWSIVVRAGVTSDTGPT